MRIIVVFAREVGQPPQKIKYKKTFWKPLILYTLLTAKKAKIFDKIIVSSDSNKILNISKKYADLVIKRPKALSHDYAPKIPAIKHALKSAETFYKKKFDIIVDLDATAPLRNTSDIKGAIKSFIRKKNFNLFSVSKSNKNPYYNMVEKRGKVVKIIKNSRINFYRRQQAPKYMTLTLQSTFGKEVLY